MLVGITIIILLTAKFRVHAFFALMIACCVTGLGVGMGMANVITVIKEGFGNIMRSLGFIIVLGTALGVLLEHTGSTKVMAAYILKKVGERNAALALSITGFIVGLPIFCDSGYIVLNGLNKSLSKIRLDFNSNLQHYVYKNLSSFFLLHNTTIFDDLNENVLLVK